MDVLRTFIAAPLPESYQAAVAEIARRLKPGLKSRMTWTRPGNWHLTLKFLGDTLEENLPGIKAALASIRFKPFAFKAGGGGFFPPPGGRRDSPRVLWIGCEQGGKEVTALAASVEKVLAPLGYAPERRPFSPHLTLARIKKAEFDPWDKVIEKLNGYSWPELTMDSFKLIRSELNPRGAEYTTLAVFEADKNL